MARPRKDDPQGVATAKIEEAFWCLLEEVGYSEITVRRVCQAASTNRNSFYYHYKSLEDLARRAFQDNSELARPLISLLLAGFQDGGMGDVQHGAELVLHAGRVMLCARSESAFLRRMVNELLRDAWFVELGISENLMTDDERAQADFIFAGLVAVLGSNAAAESPFILTRLAASQVGQASLATLRGIAERQSDNAPGEMW